MSLLCFFLYNLVKACLHGSVNRHCEKNYTVIRRSNLRKCVINFMRLPRSLRLLAMTIWYLYKDSPSMTRKILVVPDIGFELMTYRLQGGCSTTELIRHINMIIEKRYVLSYPWLDHNI